MAYTCTSSNNLSVVDNNSGGVTLTNIGNSNGLFVLYSDTTSFSDSGYEAIDAWGNYACLSETTLNGMGTSTLTDSQVPSTGTRHYVLANMGSASQTYVTIPNATGSATYSATSTLTPTASRNGTALSATLTGSILSVTGNNSTLLGCYPNSAFYKTSNFVSDGAYSIDNFPSGMSGVNGTLTYGTYESSCIASFVDNECSTTAGTYYYYYADSTNNNVLNLMATVVLSSSTSATQLTAPTVTTTTTATSITPSWGSISNASSYKLRYGTSNPPTGDGTTWSSGTDISNLTSSTTYYIQVKSIGDGSSYTDSEWSSVVTSSTSASGGSGSADISAVATNGSTTYVTSITGTKLVVLAVPINNGSTLGSYPNGYYRSTRSDLAGVSDISSVSSDVLRIDSGTNGGIISGENGYQLCGFYDNNMPTTPGTYYYYCFDGMSNYLSLGAQVVISATAPPFTISAVTPFATGAYIGATSNKMSLCVDWNSDQRISGTGTITRSTTNNASNAVSFSYDTLTSSSQDGYTGFSDNEFPGIGSYYYFGNDLSGSPALITTANATSTTATTTLDTPTNVAVVSGSTSSVSVTWTAVSNASSYKVRYSTVNPPTGTGTTATSGTTLTGLTSGTTYYVQVMAVGDGSSYSDSSWSTVVSGTPTALTVLSAPSISIASKTTTSIVLSTWSNATGQSGTKIRYGATNPPTGDGTSVTSGETIVGLSASTTYYFQFKAIGNGTTHTDSEWSSVTSITTNAPSALSAPVLTSVVALSTSGVTASWNAVSHASSYVIRHSSSSTPTGTGTNVGNTLTQNITGYNDATTVYVQVKAIGDGSSYSDSDWSSIVSGTTTDSTAPIISLVGESSVSLGYNATWTDPGVTITDNSGSTITPVVTYTLNGAAQQLFSTISAGTWVITYTATDNSGNSNYVTRTVVVSQFAITNFDATKIVNGVLCTFTTPIGVSPTATVRWQRTTTNPETGTPVWTTVATTNLNGTVITE